MAAALGVALVTVSHYGPLVGWVTRMVTFSMTRWMSAPSAYTHSRATNVGNFWAAAKTRKWHAKTTSKGSGTNWAVSESRTSRGRDPADSRLKVGWLWTTSIDVSSQVLTFVRPSRLLVLELLGPSPHASMVHHRWEEELASTSPQSCEDNGVQWLVVV